MFTVERVTTFEYYCPDGHTLAELNQSHRARFCYTCGLRLEERQVPYDAAYCTTCRSPVNPEWDYCPNCGQVRENGTS